STSLDRIRVVCGSVLVNYAGRLAERWIDGSDRRRVGRSGGQSGQPLRHRVECLVEGVGDACGGDRVERGAGEGDVRGQARGGPGLGGTDSGGEGDVEIG